MRGLKTQESEKFQRFHELVQRQAEKQNGVWFGFAREGNEFETDQMEGENLSGWLIPKKDADEFESEWLKVQGMKGLEKWLRFFKWVEWQMDVDGNVTVEFVDE